MATSSSNILELVSISKMYDHDLFQKKRLAIDSLSCPFPRGISTGILGHNGAGKTSAIRTIFGLVRPDKGDILFNGQKIRPDDRRRIGYMPETNKLPPTLTCTEFLRQQLYFYRPLNLPAKKFRDVIKEKLEEVGLGEHQNKRIDRLSKGMGRRLAYAQATIHEPELVVLDEPLSGLDPVGRRQMIRWIRDLKAKKVSLIVCMHELEALMDLCDEFHVLKHGRLVYSTLDGDKSKSAKSPLYRLKVSGCDDGGLEKLKGEHKLRPWHEMKKAGYLTELTFTQYPEAAGWLGACLSKGYVVTSFGEVAERDQKALFEHLDGGSV